MREKRTSERGWGGEGGYGRERRQHYRNVSMRTDTSTKKFVIDSFGQSNTRVRRDGCMSEGNREKGSERSKPDESVGVV